ncbi:MAG: DUF1571 domain-containing protein [Gemmataceae bacterium]|nr:DUF1571 domain-containing protein [Gemmataceae bacterium]
MRAKMWAAGVMAGVMAGVGALATAQPPRIGGDVKAEPGKAPEAVAAKGDALTAMLTESRTALGKLRDYTCTFTRQESVKGALGGEQVGEMKARTSPVGVYVRFARPEAIAGMEVAYTAARKKNDKMLYRPAGVGGAKGFRLIDLDDAKFLAENRHPVTEWTMSALMDRVSAAVAREKTLKNPVEVFTGEYQFAGRNVVRYEIVTARPHAFRYAHRMLVYIDKEMSLPLRFEAYGQPKGGEAVGDLFEVYSFSDVKTNVGLGENAFDF